MDRGQEDKEAHRAAPYRPVVLVTLLSVLLLAACAPKVNYSLLEGYVRADDCDRATGYVEGRADKYGPNRKLLFLLDAATVKMLCDDFEGSNRYFHEAEELAEALWTKSITREAASFIVNDYTIPYSGEDFERALINLFAALNYAVMGRLEEALVECRRLDANLSVYNQKYEKKNVYKEDAFGRYLSGLIYESVGELDDAYIDYRKSFEAFQDYGRNYGTAAPSALLEDLVRVGRRTGRVEELALLLGDSPVPEEDEISREYDAAGGPEGGVDGPEEGHARIILIGFSGFAPVKEESKIVVPTSAGPIAVAFPRYRVQPPGCQSMRLLAHSPGGTREAPAQLVEDINRIAVKSLEDRMGRVIAKVAARAVVKQVAIDAATRGIEDKDTRDLSRYLLNVLNVFVEKADTRSWRTLPGEIYLARLDVPEGSYQIEALHCGSETGIADEISLKKGETRFFLFSTTN